MCRGERGREGVLGSDGDSERREFSADAPRSAADTRRNATFQPWLWRGQRRSLVVASANGAWGVSWSRLRDKHPGTPGRNRVAGLINNKLFETACGGRRSGALVSGISARRRRRERLIREKIIGHGMRAGLGARFSSCGTRGRTLALFQQPAREHRAGVFVEPLIEQVSNFLTKVGRVT